MLSTPTAHKCAYHYYSQQYMPTHLLTTHVTQTHLNNTHAHTFALSFRQFDSFLLATQRMQRFLRTHKNLFGRRTTNGSSVAVYDTLFFIYFTFLSLILSLVRFLFLIITSHSSRRALDPATPDMATCGTCHLL